MPAFLEQLPGRLVSDDLLSRFVKIFEEVNDGVLVHADALEHMADVSVTSPEMVRFLGLWTGADDIDPTLPVLRQRQIVQERSRLLPWRGTRVGLEGLLALLTGGAAEVRDNGGVFAEGEAPSDPPRVKISVEGTGEGTESQLVALIQRELPVEVAFELHIAQRMAWPREDAGPNLAHSASSHQPETAEE